ncbi:hypothetical protein [Labrys neptuniae]
MTQWQVTYPNTWRDNLAIWATMPAVLALLGAAFVLIVGQAIWRDGNKV